MLPSRVNVRALYPKGCAIEKQIVGAPLADAGCVRGRCSLLNRSRKTCLEFIKCGSKRECGHCTSEGPMVCCGSCTCVVPKRLRPAPMRAEARPASREDSPGVAEYGVRAAQARGAA
eukprot:115305-Pleurochrysis_carterae.AAC.1